MHYSTVGSAGEKILIKNRMAYSPLTLLLLWLLSSTRADIMQCMHESCIISSNDTQLDAADPKFSSSEMQYTVTSVRFDTPNLKEFPTDVLAKFFNLTTVHVSQTNIEVIHALPNSPKLKTIDIGQNRIKHLSNGLFVNASTCAHLNVSHNALRVIYEEAFAGLTNVKVLKLDHNQLNTLPLLVFEHLKKLKFLRLDHNQFVTLDTQLFAPTVRLTDLNIASNPLTAITKPLIEVTIESLKLDNTSLSDVRNLTTFKRLNNLHLSHNHQLHIVRDTFSGLPNLRELFLGRMALNRMPDDFAWLAPLQKLQYLELDNNHLRMLNLSTFPRLRHLRTLSLGHNNLSSLVSYTSLTKANFPNLVHVYIAQNKWNCSFLDEMRAHLNASGIEVMANRNNPTVIECEGSLVVVVPWNSMMKISLCLVIGMIVVVVLIFTLICRKRQTRKVRGEDEHPIAGTEMCEITVVLKETSKEFMFQ